MKSLIKAILYFLYARSHAHKSNSIVKRHVKLTRETTLEGKNLINKNVNISNSILGFGTYIAENSKLTNSIIGKYCSIGPNVEIISGRHPSTKYVSTHPAFFSINKQAGFTYVKETEFEEVKYTDNDKYVVNIGNDVWIGAGAKILDGSKIGNGVIVAAGAVVVGSLEPYNIYGGVPAKKIGTRFSPDECEFLLEFKWWEKEEAWIKENINLFKDIELFYNKNLSVNKKSRVD